MEIRNCDYCTFVVSDPAEPEVEINGKSVGTNFQDYLDWLDQNLREAKRCRLCNHELGQHSVGRYEDDSPGSEHQLWWCPNCLYWQFGGFKLESDEPVFGQSTLSVCAVSKLRPFNPKLPDGCHEEIAQHMRRNPGYWHSSDPQRFEKFIASVFRHNFSVAEVLHVGGPGDGGVDVFVDSGEDQWLVQVKRRENPNSSEGVTTFRSLLGAMDDSDSSHGILVSTADHFTHAVYDGVFRRSQRGQYSKTIKVFDRHVLKRLLDGMLPVTPWREFLELQLPELVPELCDAIDNRVSNPNQMQLFSSMDLKLF